MGLSAFKNFQTRYQSEEGAFSFSNGAESYLQLLGQIGFIIGDLKSNQVNGILNVVNSKNFQESQTFNPHNDPTTGYMLDWYYVEKAANVNSSCTKVMSTGIGEETYNQEVKTEWDFQPGCNLMKYEISKIYMGRSGKKYTQTMSYSILDEIPINTKYFFIKK